jgi:HPt (histidine-containing phosphotransfer) domain-containing protein
VPIIALTANALSGSDEMFLKNGFDGFISKPIDIFRLDAVLNKWVNAGKNTENAENTGAWERNAPPAESGVLNGLRVEGIDIEAGILRYAGEAAYLPILRSYLLHTPPLLETLRPGTLKDEKPSEEDLQKYVIAIHGLKGSSRGVGADGLGKLAETLELAAKAGDWETVRAENDVLLEKAEALLVQLKALLKIASERLSESGPPVSEGAKERRAAPDPVLLEKMLSAARRSKSSQMEELMAALENCDYDSGADLVAWLRERIENIEYDAVAERLESLLAGS